MDDFILKITAEIVITQEDVDDIMSTALDSSMLQCWCSEVNVVGRYLGEYASDQIRSAGAANWNCMKLRKKRIVP